MPLVIESGEPESVPALAARIIDRHHAFLRRSLPEVSILVAKIAEVHGARVPELLELRATVEALRAALESGMDDEETHLFPLLMTGREDIAAAAALRTLEATSKTVRTAFDHVRSLTAEYRAPEGACRTWVRALVELEDLETDLERHLALEQRLRARASAP